MPRLRRAAAGFSMIELMIVTVLMATIIMGLFSLQDVLLRQRGTVLRNISVRNQNDYARRIIMRELSSFTVLQEPATGYTSNNIVGWKNLDPSNVYCTTPVSPAGAAPCCTACDPAKNAPAGCYGGNASVCAAVPPGPTYQAYINFWKPLVAANPVEWVRFCYDATNQQLDYYHGTIGPLGGGSCINYPASVACGTAAPAATCGTGTTTPEVLAGVNGANVQLGQADPSQTTLFSRPRNNWVAVAFSVINTGINDTSKADTTIGISTLTGDQGTSQW